MLTTIPNRLKRCLFSNQNYCILVTCFKWSAFCFRISMRIIGPLMFLLANSLIVAVTYTFFTKLLPEIAGDSRLLQGLHTGIGIFLFVNVIFNYMSCAFTAPGSPEICSDPGKYFGQVSLDIENRTVHQIRNRLDLEPGVYYRFCRHCKAIKPPRSHHCSISGKCILNMDHFCPWMSNCVGYYNYRYFVLFLFYMFVGSLYVLCTSIEPFFSAPPPGSGLSRLESITDIYVLLYLILLPFSAGFSTGVLLLWHVYLSLTNQTTIEFYSNIAERQDAKQEGTTFKNPFDHGWRKNIRRVFGDVPWYRALCISRRHPVAPEYPWLPDEKPCGLGAKNSSGLGANSESGQYRVVSRV